MKQAARFINYMEKASPNLGKQLKTQRKMFEDLVKRRFVYTQTAEIYGGVAGLFDYGPIGTAIKTNLITQWRRHFLLEDDIQEISCTTLVPRPVFKASGHEDRFNDFMVKDEETGDIFRVDKLIEDVLEERIENHKLLESGGKKKGAKKLAPEVLKRYSEILSTIGNISTSEGFDALVNELNLKNPNAKKKQSGKLSSAYEFNLMFITQIGPEGNSRAYLRPETAQCIFTNFKRLLEFNNSKLPFGTSIIGSAYRNEIAPRNGLLRVREFEMAEIEYFVDPLDKNCPKFSNVSDLQVPVYSQALQESNQEPETMTLKDAVENGVIANSYLGYYIGRTYLFGLKIGLHPNGMRFRQHLKGEMAHYACDCWDMEVLTSYGWIECVGIADRSAYDLGAHSKHSGERLCASRILEKPIEKQVVQYNLNKSLMGKTFKRDNNEVQKLLEDLSDEDWFALKKDIETNGTYLLAGKFTLTKEMFKSLTEETKIIQEEKFTPNVIEPSYGLGRLVYSVLEHSFAYRENDKRRCFFNFPLKLSPYKVILLPLMNTDELVEIVNKLETDLKRQGLAVRVDAGSAAIGKRYARTDEMGVPFGVTVDPQTQEDQTVTFRSTKTMEQVRMPLGDVSTVLKDLLENPDASFEGLKKKYPVFN